MEKLMDTFVGDLKKINGENLDAVVRFAGNRMMIVLKKIELGDLLMNSRLVRTMERKKVIPLFLTEENIRTSCDVFPLEYSIIKHGGRPLFGTNLLAQIEIPSENMRLESEQKIKGCLIRLTQVILERGKDKNAVKRTIFQSLEDLFAGMEGLLELTKTEITHSTEEMICELQQVSGLDLGSLLKVFAWKKTKKADEPEKLAEEYYETVKALAVYADAPGAGK